MTGLAFTYEALPGRVVFGVGSRHRIADEVVNAGGTAVLVVAGEGEAAIADEVGSELGELSVGRFTDVVQHVPRAKARDAVAMAGRSGADTVVTIGGGSATGFGKAIALETDVLQVCVPTTYAGSEMTPIWGVTDGDTKRTGNDPRVKPAVVVYDPELTLTLPVSIAAPSGMNAMAHSIEALYAPGGNPVISAMAIESIAALDTGLRDLVGQPDNIDARTAVLYGAYLAGVALATAGTALHHKTCHVLGGMFGLDHGQMNSVVLPHAVAYNAPAIPHVLSRIAAAMHTEPAEVPPALFDLSIAIGAPTSIAAIGMPEDGISDAAQRIVAEASGNVRPPTQDGIEEMLRTAFRGDRPPPVDAHRGMTQ